MGSGDRWKDSVRMFVGLRAIETKLRTTAILHIALVRRAQTCARENFGRAAAVSAWKKRFTGNHGVMLVNDDDEEAVRQPGYNGVVAGQSKKHGAFC